MLADQELGCPSISSKVLSLGTTKNRQTESSGCVVAYGEMSARDGRALVPGSSLPERCS